MHSQRFARSVPVLSLVAWALVATPPVRAAGEPGCTPSWIQSFGEMPGVDGEVGALGVFDDGSGPALYAGGSFAHAGAVEALRVARWDGTSWSPLNAGIQLATGEVVVHTFATFDDGSGPALYVGGAFRIVDGVRTRNVARWNGTSWSSVADGTGIGEVNALVVHDDGSGPALYAAGAFSSAGGVPASNIARWDGSAWSPLGAGTNDTVHALAVYDDGGGAALYASGTFTSVGGVAASRIARWDGVAWSPLAAGANGTVLALAVFDGGGGPELCAGGFFTSAGGVTANRLARWDGTSWGSLGNGVAGPASFVRALAVHDDGGGPALFITGEFFEVDGRPASRVARWDGVSWTALGDGVRGPLNTTRALASYDDGNGARLFVAGEFRTAPGLGMHVGAWDGTRWQPPSRAPSGRVTALEVHDEGGGSALYVAGAFETIGGVVSAGVSRYDGAHFTPLIGGLAPGEPRDLAWHAGELYASGGVRWDGSTWSYFGGALEPGGSDLRVLEVFDDGGGPALYVGGAFDRARLGLTAVDLHNVARYDGPSYAPLGGGTNGVVSALETFDDGGGAALYAGGAFTLAGGVQVGSVARWDGVAWSAVGRGVGGAVLALAVHDDGSGSALYAGGDFTSAGGVAASRVARWNGTSWSAVGAGLDDDVEVLLAFDDGNGPALYAGGRFASTAGHVARWDGSTWSPLGAGISDEALQEGGNASVFALAGFDAGGGARLHVGGQFQQAFDSRDAFLAVWGCPSSAATFCAGDAASCPCGNAGTAGAGCDNAQGTGGVTLALVAQTSAPNGATLAGTGFPPGATPTSIALRSGALDPAQPVVFGDGLRCLATASLVRLGATTATGGGAQHAIAHLAAAGDFHYQLWYRNTPSAYCDPQAAFNLSSGVRLTWP